MAGQKNKTSKKSRTPRVVANPKPIHRRGGRKPQERRITNADKVLGIQKALKTETLRYIDAFNVPIDDNVMFYVDYLVGLDPFDSSPLLMVRTMHSVEQAFYKACKLVPDSAVAYIDDIDTVELIPAIRGRRQSFFADLVREEEKKLASDRQRRLTNNRRNGRPGVRHGQFAR